MAAGLLLFGLCGYRGSPAYGHSSAADSAAADSAGDNDDADADAGAVADADDASAAARRTRYRVSQAASWGKHRSLPALWLASQAATLAKPRQAAVKTTLAWTSGGPAAPQVWRHLCKERSLPCCSAEKGQQEFFSTLDAQARHL